MTRESTYLAGLRRLRLRTLQPYLEAQGWKRGRDYQDSLATFNKEASPVRQLLVPLRPDFNDFLQLMKQLFAELARSEDRSEWSVLHDIYSSNTDVVRFRTQSLVASRGTLPLYQGVALLEGARRSLLASACTVLAPGQSYHPKMNLPLAEEFVDACELAQTEEGSFAIVLQCPLEAVDGVPVPEQIPFARKATDTLLTSVTELVRAIEKDRTEALVNATREGSGPGLTANLCEALTRMRPNDKDGGLTLSVSWATMLPRSGTSSVVQIPDNVFPRISEVGRRLRGSPDELQNASFPARIEVLSGNEIDAEGRRFGEVRMSLVLGEEDALVRARAILNADQYALANLAHMSNQFVMITGVLNRTTRPAVLSLVTDFTLIGEPSRPQSPTPRPEG